MEPQLIAVLMIVGVAAIYIARRTIRTWAGGMATGGCSGGCGCSRVVDRQKAATVEVLIPADQLRVRRRP